MSEQTDHLGYNEVFCECLECKKVYHFIVSKEDYEKLKTINFKFLKCEKCMKKKENKK